MSGFSVKVDENDLAKVRIAMMGIKNGYPKVVTRSLNKTLTGVRTDSVREIQKVITPNAKIIRDTFKLEKANYAKLSATIKSIGKPLPLLAYKANQTKKGVTVQVEKASARVLFHGAFIATVKKHKGVFQRKKPPYRTKRSNKLPWKRFAEKYRLPIEEKFGPKVPDIMGRAEVMKPILEKARIRLKKELDHQLDLALGKL